MIWVLTILTTWGQFDSKPMPDYITCRVYQAHNVATPGVNAYCERVRYVAA